MESKCARNVLLYVSQRRWIRTTARHDELEGEDMLVFVYEAKGGDLALNNVPAEDSYIQVNEGRGYKGLQYLKNSRSLTQMPCKFKSSVDRVVFS
jgi:hypothetical protein